MRITVTLAALLQAGYDGYKEDGEYIKQFIEETFFNGADNVISSIQIPPYGLTQQLMPYSSWYVIEIEPN